MTTIGSPSVLPRDGGGPLRFVGVITPAVKGPGNTGRGLRGQKE